MAISWRGWWQAAALAATVALLLPLATFLVAVWLLGWQLQHVESRTTIDLFRRVASTPNLDCGSRGRFQGTYRFDDSFTGNLWSFPSMASSLPAGDYFGSTSGGTKALLVGAGGFRGQGVSGTWRLTITDNVAGDTGSLGGWTLRLTP